MNDMKKKNYILLLLQYYFINSYKLFIIRYIVVSNKQKKMLKVDSINFLLNLIEI